MISGRRAASSIEQLAPAPGVQVPGVTGCEADASLQHGQPGACF